MKTNIKILKNEAYMLLKGRWLMLLLCILVHITICCLPISYDDIADDYYYIRWISENKWGKYSDVKSAIDERLERINECILEYDTVQEQYLNDTIDLEEFKYADDAYKLALAEKRAVNYLRDKAEYSFENDIDGVLVDDIKWQGYFDSNNYEYAVLLFVFMIIIPYGVMDCSRERKDALRVCRYGTTKLSFIRIVNVLLVTSIFVAFILVLRYIILVGTIGGEVLNITAGNMLGYAEYKSLTIKELYMYEAVIRYVIWILGAYVSYAVARVTENSYISMFMIVAITYIPSII